MLSVNVVSPRIIMQSLLYKARQLALYGAVTLALVLLAWAAFKGVHSLFVEGERFQLTEMKISPEPGKDSFLTYATFPEISGLECGVSLFSYDLGEIEAKLSEMPEVKSASLMRRYPGTIVADITERVPVAKIEFGGERYLVDNGGYCFRSQLAVSSLWKRLPQVSPMYKHELGIQEGSNLLTDVGMKRALHLAECWSVHNLDVGLESIHVKNYHSLCAYTKTGEELIFGYYQHERQIKDYVSILAHTLETKQEIKTVNLLPFKNIPVVYKTEQGKEAQPVKKKELNPEPKIGEDILMILEQG